MGINKDTIGLIDSLAKNDYQRAKGFAKCIIANDTSEKNRRWRDRVTRELDSAGSGICGINLPFNISGMCELEDVRLTFREDRYLLPDTEQNIVDMILRKQRVCERMAVLDVPMGNTTLLCGESGTGKTTLGKYISYKLGKPFLYLKFSNLIDYYMGKTSSNISLIFDFFRANDVVLMLDEIDTISRKRTKGGGTDGEMNRITVTIMQELDNIRPGSVVIAATNRADLIDDALLRRFSIKHEVKRLDQMQRAQLTRMFWDSVGIEPPINLTEYAKNDRTQAQIIIDMVENLAGYLENHTQYLEAEEKVINRVSSLPDTYKKLFLQVAEELDDKLVCEEVLKSDYSIGQIIGSRQYEWPGDTYSEKFQEVSYAIWICMLAYKEVHLIQSNPTLAEVADWLKAQF